MKKVIIPIFIIIVLLSMFNIVHAAPFQSTNQLEQQTESELVNMKSKAEIEIQNYEELYGSKAYGYTAYILNKIQIFSIPLCFLGIAVGSIYQYVIGIRRLDVRDKGFGLIIGFVTILVICQILPLVFAIVVQGWRG